MITPSHTITYTNYLKEEQKEEKLDYLINCNLDSLEQILRYNIKNNIHFYRLTSKLIPLVTHKDVSFDYITPYINKYELIGVLLKKYDIRMDTHPDQFTVLNSTNKEVLENTNRILEYHYRILKAFKIDIPIIILHVGSSVFGKKKAIERFIYNFRQLPKYIQECIVLENDDKVYQVEDVLYICRILNIPMVLDYHHYVCNHNNDLDEYLKDILGTWNNIRPKIHFSSPKSNNKKDFRSHHDYIDVDSFITFIEILKKYNIDVDIMIEAKAKDEALFRLVRQLKYKTDYYFIDDTTFIV